jgi:small multidrug resistance family-3 protein
MKIFVWWIEGQIPDRWDITGGSLCLLGAVVIMLAPRG